MVSRFVITLSDSSATSTAQSSVDNDGDLIVPRRTGGGGTKLLLIGNLVAGYKVCKADRTLTL